MSSEKRSGTEIYNLCRSVERVVKHLPKEDGVTIILMVYARLAQDFGMTPEKSADIVLEVMNGMPKICQVSSDPGEAIEQGERL